MIIFTANEGNMSANNIAPVDRVLQDLIPVVFNGSTVVLLVNSITGSLINNGNEDEGGGKRKKKKKKMIY